MVLDLSFWKNPLFFLIIPAHARIQTVSFLATWMPGCAGMTNFFFGCRQGMLSIRG